MENICNIPKAVSDKVLVVAEEFRNNAPGGIAAVLQYYRPNFETFKYVPTFKSRKFWDKLTYVGGAYFKLFWRLLTDKEIQIVHIHTAADGSFRTNSRLLKIAKLFGKKVILHIHASRFKDYYNEACGKKQAEIFYSLDSADKIIVLSKSWKAWFQSIGIAEDKLEILHNITAYPTKLDVSKSDRVNFLFLGEIGERKGVFDIIEAISKHKDALKDKILLNIGGNKKEKELKEAIARNGLADFVKFHGFVFGDKKLELLNRADVFILPSRNEGLPISILEAMSYGCAVISSPVGGIPEVVNKNGILVTPGNIEEIYQAIEKMTNLDSVKQMGQYSLEIVQSYYPDAVMADLLNIYKGQLAFTKK